MLVRSPLGNAPAFVAALWLCAVPGAAQAMHRQRRWLALGSGLTLIVLGALPILGNTLFAPYQRAVARQERPPLAALQGAAACMPFEPRWAALLAQEHLFAADRAAESGDQATFARELDRAATHASRAIGLRPFDPELYVWLIEILAKAGRGREALELCKYALKLDAANPILRVALSTRLCDNGDADAAIAAVIYEPHPLLRARLTRHFADLAALATERRDPAAAARFAVEHHFLASVDGLGDTEPTALIETGEHVQQMWQAMRAAGLPNDVRALATSALHYVDLEKRDEAIQLGEAAAKLDVRLQGWQRDLFGDKLAPLRTFATWAPLVGAR